MPCLFCQIISREIPSEIIYEDEHVVAFNDIFPQAPVHFLVVPKKHIDTIMEITPEHEALIGHLVFCAQKIAKEQGCEEKGARFVFNCKTDGGQTVGHIHLHALGKRQMEWPPG